MTKGFRTLMTAAGMLLAFGAAEPVKAAEAFIDRFESDLDASGWRASEYGHPGQWLDTRWAKRQLDRPEGGGLQISLEPDFRTNKGFASGEVRRKKPTHYGRYEAVLQAVRGSGLNTAFFVYTGPHRNDPKDEIDFEILGRDTTRVFVNAFVDGKKLKGTSVPLGFDAAAGQNLYALEWSADAIKWYGNGQLLYELTTADGPLPTTPGQVYLSLWAGHSSLKDWLGLADPATTGEALYTCVSFVPIGGTGAQCSD